MNETTQNIFDITRKYKAYWRIRGVLEVYEFETSKEFRQMCENIEVSEGEEGRSVNLLFVGRKWSDKEDEEVILPDTAYMLFDNED